AEPIVELSEQLGHLAAVGGVASKRHRACLLGEIGEIGSPPGGERDFDPRFVKDLGQRGGHPRTDTDYQCCPIPMLRHDDVLLIAAADLPTCQTGVRTPCSVC